MAFAPLYHFLFTVAFRATDLTAFCALLCICFTMSFAVFSIQENNTHIKNICIIS